jgi:hypothetical protein
MRTMDLRALGTFCFFAPKCRAEHHADGYANRQPCAYVSGHHSEDRAQRRSERDAPSRVL